MALASGARLGPYEIVAPIGGGGMGEVYRARDIRLDRSVAIKILPPALATDPQLRDRFEREARAMSSLNHPHICTLFDVGQQDGVDFLVLEYLEGETLAERLKRARRLDPADALKIAADLCDALDKAHRAGIVHRDLKPANVMLTKAGAKLLDFGLAKSAAPVVAASALSLLPTTPPNLTAQGTILGTFQYMAPEQIEGLEADARTDIFALGALLFEMLTGRTAFEGKTHPSLLGAILKDEPPLPSRIVPASPAALDRIVRTCLAKEPDDRYQSARDLLRELKWAAAGSSEPAAAGTAAARNLSHRAAWLVAAVATLALIVVAAIAFRRDATAVQEPVQFTIAAPDGASFGGPEGGGTGTATQLTVSPDGRNVVFVAGARSGYQIWLRPLAAQSATPIAGTEGGTFPFWSPDSRSIGFFAGGKLKKVQISGGPAIALCDAPMGRGGSWNRDNVILFAPTAGISGVGLMRVSSAGGAPTVVTMLDSTTGSNSHRWPHFLPDGRRFIYTATKGTCCPATEPSAIRLGSLDSADPEITLFETESSVSYSSGHLFFARDETLMAQPFDPAAGALKGEAFPLAERVGPEGSRYVSVSVSQTGTLVYAQSSQTARQLVWFDRSGRTIDTLLDLVTGGSPRNRTQSGNPALAPDEKRVALSLFSGTPENQDIWIVDTARKVRDRVTVDPDLDRAPVWSPDGSRIVFGARRAGKFFLRQKDLERTAADEPLLESSDQIQPTDWSKDGRFILYTVYGTFPLRSDLWVLPLFGDRKPFPVAQTASFESAGTFSPDGRWLAFTSNESGETEVYVQPFPAGGKPYRVSRAGGGQPVWRADREELFFVAADGSMMAAPIIIQSDRMTVAPIIVRSDRFETGGPQALFAAISEASLTLTMHQYAVTKDGTRFLVNTRPHQSNDAPLTVVVNWPATVVK